MTNIKLAPSILSADFCRLGEEASSVLRAGADFIHVDVMDGIFVPNISIGVPVVKSLRENFPEVFLDVHMMITKPGRYVDAFCEAGADLVTLHVEADEPQNITDAIARVKQNGRKIGLSLKPRTPAQVLLPWLSQLDMVLVMTVEPGFGGQSFMVDQMPKLRKIRQMLDAANPGCELQVDGGVSAQTAGACIAAGANVLVAGSAIFQAADRAEIMNQIRSGG